jgi:hypothetical protein
MFIYSGGSAWESKPYRWLNRIQSELQLQLYLYFIEHKHN